MSEPESSHETHRREATIRNRQGVHFRPAGKLMLLANEFESEITIEYEGNRIDAKTGATALITCAIPYGATLTIEARGTDAEKSLDAIVALVNDHFGMNEYD